jgi:hypothetical protein
LLDGQKGDSTMKTHEQIFDVEANLKQVFGDNLALGLCLKMLYDLTTEEQWQNLVETTLQARRLANV